MTARHARPGWARGMVPLWRGHATAHAGLCLLPTAHRPGQAVAACAAGIEACGGRSSGYYARRGASDAFWVSTRGFSVSAGVQVRNVAGLSYTTSSAFIFPSRGCSWASNSILAALVSPSPLVHLKAAGLCRSKVALTVSTCPLCARQQHGPVARVRALR